MSAQFDFYVRRSSWLHQLDPRVKLLFVVEASLLLFVWPSIWTATAAILLCTLGLWRAQIPAANIGRIWQLMGPLMGLVFLLTALFSRAGKLVWFSVGPVVVTIESVQLGAMLALRLLALALIIFLWLVTTDQAAMVRGFRALHVPYEWSLTLALALRYLPIFAGLFTQVQEAQQARGLDLEGRGFWQRVRAYRPVLVAMVIIAVRQSEQLGWALEARALNAHGMTRTVFRPLHFRTEDRAITAALIVVGIVVLALRVARYV